MPLADLCGHGHFPHIPIISHFQGALRVRLLCFQTDELLHEFCLCLDRVLPDGAARDNRECYLGANSHHSHPLLANPHLSRMLQNVLWQEDKKRWSDACRRWVTRWKTCRH